MTLLHLTYLSFTNYLVVLRFHGLEDIDRRYTVSDVLFGVRGQAGRTAVMGQSTAVLGERIDREDRPGDRGGG